VRSRLIRWGLPVMLVAVGGVGAAMAASAATHAGVTVKAASSSALGTVLVGPNGRTLYRYTLDRKGVNRCSSDAACSKFWPALLVKAGTVPTAGSGVRSGLLGTIKAAHGMRQVTAAGFPLYLFAGDKAAGQTKGQGFGSQWYAVSATGALVKHAAAAPTPTPAPTTTPAAGGGDAWG